MRLRRVPLRRAWGQPEGSQRLRALRRPPLERATAASAALVAPGRSSAASTLRRLAWLALRVDAVVLALDQLVSDLQLLVLVVQRMLRALNAVTALAPSSRMG
eukprot:7391399-Prymnesium_polylepis.1